MLYCENCGVFVRGEREACPLCQGPLTGRAEGGEVFPAVPLPAQPYHLFFRLLIFLSLAAAVVCVAVNAMLPAGGWWSLFVVAGIACMWLGLAVVVKKRRNLLKSLMWQVALISALAVVWDFGTGWHGWSLDYVLPILCMAAMAAMAVMAKVMRLPIGAYLIYLVLDGLFGILPVLFMVLRLVRVVYPSVICAAVSVLSLSALLTFQGERMWGECKRRLHL